MATRPASDWVTPASRPNCCEPVSTKRPGVRSASTIPCSQEKRSGQRWASSNTAPPGKRARNPRASVAAKARSAGSSRET